MSRQPARARNVDGNLILTLSNTPQSTRPAITAEKWDTSQRSVEQRLEIGRGSVMLNDMRRLHTPTVQIRTDRKGIDEGVPLWYDNQFILTITLR